MDCSPPGSSILGISQAGILEWVAISSFRGSPPPRDWTCISCIGRRILYHWATWEGEKHIITMINMASFLERELKFACGSRGGLCGVVGEGYLKSVRQLWHHRGVGVPRNTCREPRHLWLAEAPVCMCVRVCICLVTMLNLTGVLSSWKTAMAKETPSPFWVPETRLKPFSLRNWDRVLDDHPS